MAQWNPSQRSSLTLTNSFHNSTGSKSLSLILSQKCTRSLRGSCLCSLVVTEVITAIKAFHRFLPFSLSLVDTIFKTQKAGELGSHIPFVDKRGGLMQYLQRQVADSVLVSFMHIIATTNDTAYVLCTKHCTEHLRYMNSFNPYNHPMRQVLLWFHLTDRRSWGAERLRYLPKIMQIVKKGPRFDPKKCESGQNVRLQDARLLAWDTVHTSENEC